MGVYDADIQAAKELIAEFGADCLWQKAAPYVEDVPGYPTQGAVPDPIPCKIVFFSPRDVGRGGEMFMALLAGTEIPTSSEIGLMAGGISFTPDDSDTIIRDPDGENLSMTIKEIDRLAPNGTPVLYYVSVGA